METVIFKNDIIEVKFTSLDSKGIIVNATVMHPETKEKKTISAGWISKTWYLHSFAKTPEYVFNAAASEFHQNIFKIAECILTHYKKMHNDYIEEWEKSEDYSRNVNNNLTINYNGRIEPLYGMADVLRYTYNKMGENLELIKNNIENSTFNKLPKGLFNNNKRRVSR